MNHSYTKNGFTLIELLVVISVILIASSIIFIGGNGGTGASLSASQRIVSGIAQGARGQAVLKNAKTRLIIHNDTSDLDKYRRFFGIVYEGIDSVGSVGWIAATQGTYLPDGIYFDAGTSASESDSGALWSTTAFGMKLNYPLLSAEVGNAGTDYLYYEFNSNGTSSNSNAYLVLRGASMIPNNEGSSVEELRVTDVESGLLSALIFRRAGTTTSVTNPEALTVSNSTKVE
jgi:prepilin-type N-terminal cleavage/methylation domain-containing protein